MNPADISSETRELAARLVALEAALANALTEDTLSTCPACEKLRRPLSTLMGAAGFASLLTRALTLAKRETSVLGAVQVLADGTLEGLEGEAAKACPILIAYVLNLLVTFIGEALLLRLLEDVWPDFSSSGPTSLRKESK